MKSPLSILAAGLALALLTPAGRAIDDIAPPDTKAILQALQAMRDQQLAAAKTNRQRFIQEATNAAANPARAVELWEEAVRATQFQGAAKETAQFREWKEKEGDALKEKEVLGALRLYFNWLSLTLQRSAGAESRTLLPAVLNQAREVQADQAIMDAFDEALRRDKESAAQGNKPKSAADRQKEKQHDADAVKKLHDKILKQPLGGSAFVQWMHLGELLKEVAPETKRRGGRNPADDEGAVTWEGTPGNYDGLYTQIILPELRVLKDVRVLEYWDAKLRREADQAGKAKLTFDVDKFNAVRRPQLLWSRAQDLARIGQRNRAITEMFGLVKANPSHPDISSWMTELETQLAPPAPPTAPAPAPATTAPAAPPATPPAEAPPTS